MKFTTRFKKYFSFVEKFFEVKTRGDTNTDVNWREITLDSIGIVDDINVQVLSRLAAAQRDHNLLY